MMRWEDERYVRLYTRDTTNWVVAPWQARAILPQVLRKLDRAGHLDLGDDGIDGLAALISFPLDIVQEGMKHWMKVRKDGHATLSMRGSVLVMDNFVTAQECRSTGAQRTREYRERQKVPEHVSPHSDFASPSVTPRHAPSRPVTDGDETSQNVTDGDTVKPTVTDGDSVLCLAVLSRTVPTPLPPAGESGVELSAEIPPSPVAQSAQPANDPSPAEPAPDYDTKSTESRLARAQWLKNAEGGEWVRRYRAAVEKAIARPWNYTSKFPMSELADVIGTHCPDMARAATWLDSIVPRFIESVGEDKPALWSSYNPKGLMRALIEDKISARTPPARSAVAPKPPAPVVSREVSNSCADALLASLARPSEAKVG